MENLSIWNTYGAYGMPQAGVSFKKRQYNDKPPVPFLPVDGKKSYQEAKSQKYGSGFWLFATAVIDAAAALILTRGKKGASNLTKTASPIEKAVVKNENTVAELTSLPNNVASKAKVLPEATQAGKSTSAVPKKTTFLKEYDARSLTGNLTKKDIDSMNCDPMTKLILYRQHGVKGGSTGFRAYLAELKKTLGDDEVMLNQIFTEHRNGLTAAEDFSKILGRPLNYTEARWFSRDGAQSIKFPITERMGVLQNLAKEKPEAIKTIMSENPMLADHYFKSNDIGSAEECINLIKRCNAWRNA